MDASTTSGHTTGLEIAVIGMSGRFPGADNVEQYWRNLCDGVESISFFSDEELLAAGIGPEALAKSNYVRAGALLRDFEYFDASFFGYSAREAEIMDPQHRIFLECAYEALEDAGYGARSNGSRAGVYAGASMSTYLFNLMSNTRLIESLGPLQILIGNDKDHLATRVSYKLNLGGPAIGVQTACSTSLVAVHLACRALLSGECDIALAGGVSVNQFRKSGYYHQEGGIFSPDGHCRAFDAHAAGTVLGNGVGIVVLKRLEDAFADRDSIHAIIRGSAVTNDGSEKVGYTAPGVYGQRQAIRSALIMAEVDPATITYVEAHGTGTAVGDPIEVEALTQAYRESTGNRSYCAIGSVKSNIGHLDAAAGVAGLIKAVLALKHRTIPPSLHFREANPKIDFADSPFYVNDRVARWEQHDSARRAAVSAFGLGGTNAHVVLEEGPGLDEVRPSRSRQLILLSAKTESALESISSRLCAHLRAHPEADFSDVAYTLKVGRRSFDRRRALVCSGAEDAIAGLESTDQRRVFTGLKDSDSRALVFMFPGQGTQYVRMGAGLYREEPVLRHFVDICSEHLRSHIGFDLREVLYPPESEAEERALQLQQTAITQPALFVIEYALAQLWMQWGVRPRAMIGHSIGEYVAACLSGVFSLEDALALVAARGKLIQELPKGGMVAVPLTAADLQNLIDSQLSIAAINGPSRCVVSGPAKRIGSLADSLRSRGIEAKHLHTSHAFHSSMMDPILQSFSSRLERVKLAPPSIPYISNVTGGWITAQQATDPEYWASHLRQTVKFADGIATLMKESKCILLEVGPGRTLVSLAKLNRDHLDKHLLLSSLPGWNDTQSDEGCILDSLGRLWVSGVEVDWQGFYADELRYRMPLPTYPFERKRYWIEPAQGAMAGTSADEIVPACDAEQSAVNDGEDLCSARLYQRPNLSTVYVAPSKEIEQRIVRIWRDFVGEMEIGVNDNFYELGGDSLMAMQMASRVRDAFKIHLPLEDVFAAPSPAALAGAIEQLLALQEDSAAQTEAIPRRQPAGTCPLSYAQMRLWFLEQMSPGTGLYNIPAAISLKGELEIGALKQSLDEVVRRHEALRTTFAESAGKPFQLVHPPAGFESPLVDLSGLTEPVRGSEARRLAMEEAGRPFDLTRGPLVRGAFLKLCEDEHVLLLTMHHVISDAYSLGVLIRELAALYKAFSAGAVSPLPELPIQYPDFAAWQREWLQGEVLETLVSYWKKQLAGSPPLLEFPADRPRSESQSSEGAAMTFELPPDLT
jgi:acyl transferase domain-containing protein